MQVRVQVRVRWEWSCAHLLQAEQLFRPVGGQDLPEGDGMLQLASVEGLQEQRAPEQDVGLSANRWVWRRFCSPATRLLDPQMPPYPTTSHGLTSRVSPPSPPQAASRESQVAAGGCSAAGGRRGCPPATCLGQSLALQVRLCLWPQSVVRGPHHGTNPTGSRRAPTKTHL